MHTVSRSGRSLWVVLVLAALVAAGAWLWLRNQHQQPTVEVLLRALPAQQAVIGYIDVPALRRAPKLGPWLDAKLAEQGQDLPLAAGVRGVSMALGADSIYFATGLDLSQAAAVGYLAERRAGCTQPLDEAVCSQPGSNGGFLSFRLLDDNVLGVAHSSDAQAAERFELEGQVRNRETATARTALDRGALAWADLDPLRLDEIMRNPPEGWVNLALIARALKPAETASLSVREMDGKIEVTLSARCGSEADAVELKALLDGLNKMASALLSAKPTSPWKSAVDSFRAAAQDQEVEGIWVLPGEVLEQ